MDGLTVGLILVGAGMLLCIVGAIIDTIGKREKQVIHHYDYSTKVYRSQLEYNIGQDDFESIVYKTTGKIKRVEDVEIDGCFVNLYIESQTGNSRWDAQLMFELSGSAESIGNFTVYSSNEDSHIPESIGKKIKIAILENVGIL